MKLVHTSDLHIGISLFSLDMLPFQETLGEAILSCAQKYSADCIIISGDVYDSSIVSAEAVKCWDRLCSTLFSGQRNIPVVVISGNHDSAPRLSVNSELLKSCGLHIRGSFVNFAEPVRLENADIYCIPFFNISDVREMFPEKEILDQTDAFAAMTEVIRSKMDRSKKNIIAAHCFAAGSQTSESERSTKGASSAGGLSSVSAEVFAGFDYVALGHLHRPQNVKCTDENTLIRYSGTPIPYSFSEAQQQKSFTVFDTDTREMILEPVPEPVRLVTVKGSFEEIMSSDIPEDAYVRAVITDKSSAAGCHDRLRGKFPRLLRTECEFTRAAGSGGETADRIEAMSLSELAGKYLKDVFEKDITDEQLAWLADAEMELNKQEK